MSCFKDCWFREMNDAYNDDCINESKDYCKNFFGGIIMPWMSEEQYAFVEDCKEKKITARSARHTRTHCGKGGSVKFPSDYMNRKELKAMNGECKSYRMNKPMQWNEFKKMPDDLQKEYIKTLRERFDVPVSILAEHMGIGSGTLNRYMRTLGLGIGAGRGKISQKWRCPNEFDKWWNGVEDDNDSVKATNDGENQTPVDDNTIDNPSNTSEIKPATFVGRSGRLKLSPQNPCGQPGIIIPKTGEMTFEGGCDVILASIASILDNRNVRLTVSWEVIE